MVNRTACPYSASNSLLEVVGRHPSRVSLASAGSWSVGSPFAGVGFTTAEAMASAFPSRGMSDPAACLAVRNLGDTDSGSLGPGGEIGGGVAVPIHNQPATTAAKGPRAQCHLLRHPSTGGAGLGRGKPALTNHQFAPEPGGLVLKLAGKLAPRGIGDGLGEALIADQVSHRKIFDGQPAVGLGELARDLMKEVSANVGNAVVLPGQQMDGFQTIPGTPLGARERPGTPP